MRYVIKSCVACGLDHFDVTVNDLSSPQGDKTKFTYCNQTKDPILLSNAEFSSLTEMPERGDYANVRAYKEALKNI